MVDGKCPKGYLDCYGVAVQVMYVFVVCLHKCFIARLRNCNIALLRQ